MHNNTVALIQPPDTDSKNMMYVPLNDTDSKNMMYVPPTDTDSKNMMYVPPTDTDSKNMSGSILFSHAVSSFVCKKMTVICIQNHLSVY
jgi:hypothetical protein